MPTKEGDFKKETLTLAKKLNTQTTGVLNYYLPDFTELARLSFSDDSKAKGENYINTLFKVFPLLLKHALNELVTQSVPRSKLVPALLRQTDSVKY